MTVEDLIALLCTWLSEESHLDPTDIDGDTDLGEASLDSISVLTIIVNVEEATGVRLIESDLGPGAAVRQTAQTILAEMTDTQK